MTNEELVLEIRQGRDTEQNLSLLCVQNERMIQYIANRFRGLESEEDLIQEGYTALIDSVYSYEPGEASFFTYAYVCIWRAIGRYISHKGALVKMPKHIKEETHFCSLDEPVFEDGVPLSETIPDENNPLDDVLEEIQHRQISGYLKQVLKELPDPEGRIIELYYYLGKTEKEIGELLGIPSYTVRRIRKKVLESLRKNDKDNILGSYVCEDYSEGLKGVSYHSFNSSWTSSTERVAIKNYTETQKAEKRLYGSSRM